MLGMHLEKGSAIHMSCYISGNKLALGQNSYINRSCILDCAKASINIGENVGIGYNCCFFTTSHNYSNPGKRTGNALGGDIVVGDGCWIGGGTVICPGVVIADGCIIGAGSVVVHDCLSKNSLYAGNPARKIKDIDKRGK